MQHFLALNKVNKIYSHFGDLYYQANTTKKHVNNAVNAIKELLPDHVQIKNVEVE